MIYNHISELIGNTPLLRIDPKVHGLKSFDLYAKLEYYNPFGSVKDRIAKGMMEPVMEELLEKKKTVLEASSGNTAKALAALAGTYDLPSKVVTNRIKIPEVRMILQILGAEIEELPGMSDCPDPLDPNDFTTVATNMAKAEPDKYHYTDQYFNEFNRGTHFETTGREIHEDLKEVHAFFGFLGTCGSSMGAGRYLREKNPNVHLYGVIADGGHHIPGGRNVNELWEVGFFKRDFYTDLLSGLTSEAIDGMLELNRRAGVMCGPTTGLTYYMAKQKLLELDKTLDPSEEKKKAVFIACDRLEFYTAYIKKNRPELFSIHTGHKVKVESLPDSEVEDCPIINSSELKEELEKDGCLVVDIRSHFAYSIGHVPGSFNILDELLQQIIEEGACFPRSKKIVVVCRIGNISKRYAAFLRRQGYESCSLKGGISEWKRGGFEMPATMKGRETAQ